MENQRKVAQGVTHTSKTISYHLKYKTIAADFDCESRHVILPNTPCTLPLQKVNALKRIQGYK